MVAAPPLRIYGLVGASLGLAVLQLSARIAQPHPLYAWLLAGLALAVSGLIALSTVLVQAKSFTVKEPHLLVKAWWQPESMAAALPLASLSSVAFTASRCFNRPLVEVTFSGGSIVRIPVRYAGAPELVKFLFGQLGQNIQAKNAV
jgi:hypothetical protein